MMFRSILTVFLHIWFVLPVIIFVSEPSNGLESHRKSLQNLDDSQAGLECPDKCPACAAEKEKCPDGVKLMYDPCGCCVHCARQEGEECSALHTCQNGLLCTNGTCRVPHPLNCTVGLKVYENGATWRPNCQTVCQCENGVYGCSDVCQPDKEPSECPFGRQLMVESQCCTRWVCREEPTTCPNVTLDWTECSCSNPISHQWTNRNAQCQWTVIQRVCSTKNCLGETRKEQKKPFTEEEIVLQAKRFCQNSLYHRYEFITEDNCRSTRMYHQKTCASECHMPNGRKLCCLPNEFESLPVLLHCDSTQKPVLRTMAVISGCDCVLC